MVSRVILSLLLTWPGKSELRAVSYASVAL